MCQHLVHTRDTTVAFAEALKQRLLQNQPQSVLAGHPGFRRMYDTLPRHVHWPEMVADIHKYMELLPACAKCRLSERKHNSTRKLFLALEPFPGLAMDLLGPFSNSKGGHQHVMVICDRFTKLK